MMFPVFRAFALVLLSATLLSASHAFSQDAKANLANFFQRLKAGEKVTVVAYGTSLTKYGAWVEMVQQWFDKKFPGQVTVINSGGPGQNSTWGLAQVQPSVLDHHPDWVFLEFAANDAHERFKLPVEKARENLETIIDDIQKQNPKAVIVLQTMNAFWDAPKGFTSADTSRSHMEDFNNNYRAVAKERNLPLIDNYPDWLRLKAEHKDEFETYLPDGTHPNKNGVLAVTWPNIEKFLDHASQP